jgi:hypothetical protein
MTRGEIIAEKERAVASALKAEEAMRKMESEAGEHRSA